MVSDSLRNRKIVDRRYKKPTASYLFGSGIRVSQALSALMITSRHSYGNMV